MVITAKTCEKCGSNAPHLHPAVQFEGEVEICTGSFHLTQTVQNTEKRAQLVTEKRQQ